MPYDPARAPGVMAMSPRTVIPDLNSYTLSRLQAQIQLRRRRPPGPCEADR